MAIPERMKKIYLVVGTLGFLFSFAADAAESAARAGTESSSTAQAESKPATPGPWKASATSLYYSFEGTRDAHDGIYGFGRTTLAMQLVQLSYQISPGWTVLAIGAYLDNYVETNMPIPGAGTVVFRDRTLGWGDTLLDVVHPLYASPSFLLFGDLGISFPTGSIDKRNPSNPLNGRYAYNMQLGSGTYDVEAGAVALYVYPYFQVGTHLSTFQRTGESANGYRLGNLYKGEGWLDVPVGLGFTPRVVGYYKVKQAIHGVDPTLGRNILTEYYHHDQQNWDLSAAVKFQHHLVGTAELVAEAGLPFTQGSRNSDQVVVSTNYYGSLGVSGTF
jgi:hypothetical protein